MPLRYRVTANLLMDRHFVGSSASPMAGAVSAHLLAEHLKSASGPQGAQTPCVIKGLGVTQTPSTERSGVVARGDGPISNKVKL